ncbi:hypothetical protein R0K19_22800, partial [Bacillus sp. SIMBA_161]
SISLSAGARLRDYIGLTDRTEQVLGLVELASDTPIALGTAQGVVKRIVPSALPVRPEVEVIALKPKDRVVGVAPAPDESDLVYLTDDAKLLR